MFTKNICKNYQKRITKRMAEYDFKNIINVIIMNVYFKDEILEHESLEELFPDLNPQLLDEIRQFVDTCDITNWLDHLSPENTFTGSE